jgi:hypothetical protein
MESGRRQLEHLTDTWRQAAALQILGDGARFAQIFSV